MDKIHTLLKKLTAEIEQQQDIAIIQHTLQALYAETLFLAPKPAITKMGSTVLYQKFCYQSIAPLSSQPANDNWQPKEIAVLEVDEDAISEELESIRQKNDFIENIVNTTRPHFTPEADIEIETEPAGNLPKTTTNQQENQPQQPIPIVDLDAFPTIQLQNHNAEKKVASEFDMNQSHIKDLKKEIIDEDKNAFINQLFRGDAAMFERSLKTINNFTAFPEAQYWVLRELKTKLGWHDHQVDVQKFDNYVRRRFSST